MTVSADRKVTIGIQRSGAVDNIDLGPLVSELSVEPWELAQDFSDEYHHDGSIEISIERTHEWEYLVVLGIAGGAVFVNAVIQALGDRFGHWIADQTSGTSRGNQEVKISTESGTSVTIPIDRIEEANDDITVVLEEASERQEKVTIEIP